MGYDQSVVYNYGQWAKGIFVGRDNVYLDGKLYDCPAPCLGHLDHAPATRSRHDLEEEVSRRP